MKRLGLDSDVAEISGVGPTRKKQLLKLGIDSVRDLIYNFPRLYEARGDVVELCDTTDEKNHAVILTVATNVKSTALRRGLTVSKFRAFDDSGAAEVVFFNSPFVKDVFRVGSRFRFYGKITKSGRIYRLSNPKYDPYVEGVELPLLSPIYPLTNGINSKFIEKIVKIALDAALCEIIDPLPVNIKERYGLISILDALVKIHFPKTNDDLFDATKRLSFDEMFFFALGITMSASRKQEIAGVTFKACDISPILNALPYELTASQKNAVNDIYRDTVHTEDKKIFPMRRILVGDVGCGKTICAALAAYISTCSGFQTALMAPTEILARQHFEELKCLFEPHGITVELLLGATTKSKKADVYSKIKSGECQIVVGTHALISDKTEFNALGLVITDEQHRFGVNQRALLQDKAQSAHMLVMSATPIPRTMALTIYGDLDITRITDMPKGRQRVDTFVVDETYRQRLNSFIEKQVLNGGQVYVVCPAISAQNIECVDGVPCSDERELEMKNVLEYTEKLRQTIVNINVACMHGKMKSFEKESVMNDFASGKINVLVSTTVIEVGVNVPNASLMIVENAERFGLAQLHQLRGRVGRGTRKSYCVLVSGNGEKPHTERLNIMRNTYDGFEIAEKDLMLRGPGDFFASMSDGSIRQSGGFDFKLAAQCEDSTLLTDAFSAARILLSEDPTLSFDENVFIKAELERVIASKSSIIS